MGLVACENAHEKESAFYASTPPLEAKKWLFSRYARERTRNGHPLQLSFVDVKKAYFYGKPTRDIYFTPPRARIALIPPSQADPVRVWHAGCWDDLGRNL